jgi:2-polyprenyl-3-methyl-5-hydroxy-6-metoxy-1,4-benzoquinol methylase
VAEANRFDAYPFDQEPQHSFSYLSPPLLEQLSRLDVKTVLEIGCGNGSLAKAMTEAGIQVTGIDPSVSGNKIARQQAPQATFIQMGVNDDPARIEQSEFDAVVASEVIEHLYRPRALLRLAHAKLRHGGVLLLTTPYHGYAKNLILSLLNRWDFHHASHKDGGHIKFWSRKSLTRLLQSEGFEVIRFHGLGRLPFLWKSMLLVARKQG